MVGFNSILDNRKEYIKATTHLIYFVISDLALTGDVVRAGI